MKHIPKRHPIASWCVGLLRHRVCTWNLVGLAAFGLSALISIFIFWPAPRVHDEFSYLLAADTFCEGRIANPPHPFWVHFETFHVNHQPTYHSMYPPAQGLFLALGQLLGHPLIGAWLSAGLACGAICWLLQAFMRPIWALAGGVLSIFLVVIAGGAMSYWSQSYWGGAVPAFAGALVFGGYRRLQQRPRMLYALLLGIGLALLANSRPYGGFVIFIPVALGLFVWMLGKKGPPLAVSMRKVVLPLAFLGSATLFAMAYYNLRTTGDALYFPYQLNADTYDVASPPYFFWQPLNEAPLHNHLEFRKFYLEWSRSRYEQNLNDLTGSTLRKLGFLFQYYLSPYFLLPMLVTIFCLWQNRWTRFALVACTLLLLALLLVDSVMPHYYAPAAGLVVLLCIQSLRYLRVLLMQAWRRGGPDNAHSGIARIIMWIPASILALDMGIETFSYIHWWEVGRPLLAAEEIAWTQVRADFQRRLENDGRKHLVLVRYLPEHNIHQEWVYNAADIDGAPVVWARSMDEERDRRLLRYFKDRSIWRLEIGASPYPTVTGPFTRFSAL